MPHGLPWPSYDGRLLSFVAQVNLADVSSFDEHGMPPAAGLLSFFYDLLQNPLGAVVSAVGFWEDTSTLARAPLPDELSHQQWTPAAALTPEAELCLIPSEPSWLTAEERDAYLWEALPQDRDLHRMLGHPDLIQPTPTPGEDILLLQVDFYDGAAFPEGAGRLYFLIAEDDLRHRRFGRTRGHYTCD